MSGFAQKFGGSGRARQRASSWILSAGSRAELACQGEWVYIEKVPKETLTFRVCFWGVWGDWWRSGGPQGRTFRRDGGVWLDGAGVAVPAVSRPDPRLPHTPAAPL